MKKKFSSSVWDKSRYSSKDTNIRLPHASWSSEVTVFTWAAFLVYNITLRIRFFANVNFISELKISIRLTICMFCKNDVYHLRYILPMRSKACLANAIPFARVWCPFSMNAYSENTMKQVQQPHTVLSWHDKSFKYKWTNFSLKICVNPNPNPYPKSLRAT